ncbi:uncharacterized protein LOC5504513 [Nematostella vectensis]|uniref:uncharacterized protein LOC5504513 n=1 Tax=Nematostella vectensis TaxID=45351 RepID=UPI002076E4E8|nr:uncharacterized protein LOC5504513 [Nematostella vectensis]
MSQKKGKFRVFLDGDDSSDDNIANKAIERKYTKTFVIMSGPNRPMRVPHSLEPLTLTNRVAEVTFCRSWNKVQVYGVLCSNLPALSTRHAASLRWFRSQDRGSKMEKVACGMIGMSGSTKNDEKGKPENEINIKKNM